MGGILGGKKGSSKSTTTTDTDNTNWLMKNTGYTNLANQGIVEGSQMTIPGQQIAGYSQNFYDTLNSMANGVDLSGYGSYQNIYDQAGSSMYQQGQGYLGSAVNTFSKLQNLTGDQFAKDYAQEYNGDLVKSRISQVSDLYNDQKNQSIQSLNQNATASGNMGSSRAGVAQGVLEAQTAKNIASSTVDIQAQEEAAVEQRLMNRYGLNQSAAGSMANIGSTQINNGMNATSLGYGVYTAGNQAQITNWNNSIYSGGTLQGIQQQNVDTAYNNSLLAQSPSLARLGYMNQVLGPMANFQTSGTQTQTTVTPQQKSSPWGSILGAVGTGVGAYFGGPLGAQLGGAVGGAVGSQI